MVKIAPCLLPVLLRSRAHPDAFAVIGAAHILLHAGVDGEVHSRGGAAKTDAVKTAQIGAVESAQPLGRACRVAIEK